MLKPDAEERVRRSSLDAKRLGILVREGELRLDCLAEPVGRLPQVQQRARGRILFLGGRLDERRHAGTAREGALIALESVERDALHRRAVFVFGVDADGFGDQEQTVGDVFRRQHARACTEPRASHSDRRDQALLAPQHPHQLAEIDLVVGVSLIRRLGGLHVDELVREKPDYLTGVRLI